jgi:ribosomal protein S27E
MGRWIERKPNWLKNVSGTNEAAEKSFGRPPKDSSDYGVRFIPIRCPKCRSKDNKCYSSHPPIRYHICNKCGHNFKSVEANDEK